MAGSRSKKSDGKYDNPTGGSRNHKGEESKGSRDRRRHKEMNNTSEGLISGLRKNKGKLPRKGIKGLLDGWF